MHRPGCKARPSSVSGPPLAVRNPKITLRSIAIAIALVAMITQPGWCKEDLTQGPRGLELYSDMAYIPEEGEAVGNQLMIIYHQNENESGAQILWRAAGPFLDKAFLYDVISDDGRTIRFDIPESHEWAGQWTLVRDGKTLHAKSNQNHKLDLKAIRMK